MSNARNVDVRSCNLSQCFGDPHPILATLGDLGTSGEKKKGEEFPFFNAASGRSRRRWQKQRPNNDNHVVKRDPVSPPKSFINWEINSQFSPLARAVSPPLQPAPQFQDRQTSQSAREFEKI
jgi:hypothetical protein